ncbi:MAG: succinylglutamate desuccinylase/aspartoacylase family protein [Woeseiaceae bacterium]|jgi:predicted deacylase|nr:succinylglutamate desuccinylase/aspartoacylase family protein [Woeseiaceae bacterium]
MAGLDPARTTLFLLVCLLAAPLRAGELPEEPPEAGSDISEDTTSEAEDDALTDAAVEAVDPALDGGVPLADAVATAAAARPLWILGQKIEPGTAARLSWSATELFEGVPVSTPVLVVNGENPGPVLCLTAAIHGDELNGIEMVRRVMHDMVPGRLSGAIIGVPIVNVQGFRRGSRYLPDRRDLNRYFPGNPRGSAASRIAHSFFTQVVMQCDALIDLHTGSQERANLPQIRADLRDPDVVTLTQGLGGMVILHSTPARGTLRAAATAAGIPTVTLEAGGPSELEVNVVKQGVLGIETLISTLSMQRRRSLWGDPEPVYYRSTWVRADSGGILFADVSLGSSVRKGDLLGTITDPVSNARAEVRSPYTGRVLGMARNQVVMPGNATFHLGIESEDRPEDIADDSAIMEIEVTGDYIDGMSE